MDVARCRRGPIYQLIGVGNNQPHPRWSRDGSKLLYGWPSHNPQTDIWIVDTVP